jgi:DNA-binding PadR family transcriptional regulator
MLFDKERSPRTGGPITRHGGQVRRHHDEERGPGGPFGPGGPAGHGPFRGRRGPGNGFGGPGRGRMTRRGDVRIAILALLGEKPMHGYQVISELDARTGGRWRPSAGSIYPTLQQLEDEGLVAGEEIDGRRVFSLTEAGTAEAARRGTSGRVPWQTEGAAGDDPAFELRRMSFAVGAAAMQVVDVGSPGSIEQAREILADARRCLYRLLAEDETPETKTTPSGL